MITKADICIAAAVIILSLSVPFVAGGASASKTVVIEVDGKTYATYDMNKINGIKTIDVNGKNTVEITKDYARVIYADCPDKRDVRQGKITGAGQIIVCLPNKMTVRITGKTVYDDISR